MELTELIERIDSLKKEIDSMRPIDQETEQRIMQKFRLDWNFHSNNIEGNSLTFGETKTFLLHGITAEGKPLKDHLDLKGHNEAILLLDDVIKNNRPMTETFIRELHEIILHEPYDKPAITLDGIPTVRKIQIGQYKKTPNHVKTATGEIFYFASPEETPAMMNDLMDWYAKVSSDGSVHPVVIAAGFHYKFIRIHPFDDGNGRMARILMNLILMKNYYPPVIIKTQEKADYFRALQIADGGDVGYFDSYIAEQLIRSLDLYLRGAKGESIEEPSDIDKEIELLKREENSSARIQIKKSREVLQRVYISSLKILLSEIDFQFKKFDDLFFETEHNYNVQGTIESTTIKGPGKNLEYIEKQIFFDYNQPEKYGQIRGEIYSQGRPSKRLQYPDINTVQIHYHWRGYKNAGVNSFDMHYTIYISFEDYKYSVAGDEPHNPILKKLYSEEISKEEINTVATKMSREILEKIKRSKGIKM